MNIIEATTNYEHWMRDCTAIVESHLRTKDAQMKEDLFLLFSRNLRPLGTELIHSHYFCLAENTFSLMHQHLPSKVGFYPFEVEYSKCGDADLNKQLRFAVRPVLVDLVRVAALAAGKVWQEVHPPPPERNTGTCPIRTDCRNWPYCGCDVVQRYRKS